MTEAIQYFQAGVDDAPLSSAASILSGRSFGNRKITLKVHIAVDYDGPSLSDTSSLASLDEYKARNESELSFSLGSPSIDLDDDSVTVSSRDTEAVPRARVGAPSALSLEWVDENKLSELSGESSWDSLSRSQGPSSTAARSTPQRNFIPAGDRGSNPFADSQASGSIVYSGDPSAVFERLKLEEELEDDSSDIGSGPLFGGDRGAAWLRDQNERTIRTMLGTLPEPSVSDSQSSSSREEVKMGGDLALQRAPSGKYYYSYTSSGSSQAQESGVDEGNYEIDPSITGETRVGKPRPTSRHLNWLEAQQIRPNPPRHTTSEPSIPEDFIPPELLQFLPLSSPPSDELTNCSECGVMLDSIRYVCSTCGEKAPYKNNSEKGKARDPFADIPFTYPPPSFPPRPNQQQHYPPSPSLSSGSQTYVGSSESLGRGPRRKPLPSLPDLHPPHSPHSPHSPHTSPPTTLTVPGILSPQEKGYELCSGCIESAGVNHAIEAGLAPGSSPSMSPSSPEDAQRALQWRRAAPKQKGQLRHAYHEKIWGYTGWEDVGMCTCLTRMLQRLKYYCFSEQDDVPASTCSACGVVTSLRKCYKCASCKKHYLCRACYR